MSDIYDQVATEAFLNRGNTPFGNDPTVATPGEAAAPVTSPVTKEQAEAITAVNAEEGAEEGGEESAEEGPRVTRSSNKADLLAAAEARKIDVPEGATNAEIADLLGL